MPKRIRFPAFLAATLVVLAAVSVSAQPGSGYSGSEVPGVKETRAEGTAPWQKLDLGYDALTDFGSDAQGYGQVASLSYELRGLRGSFGFALRYRDLPASMKALTPGMFVSARLGYAVLLSPGLSAGAGVSGAAGDNGGFGWNAALDLGIEHFVGDLGFLKEFSWGFVISGLGLSGGVSLPARSVMRSMPDLGIDPRPTARLAMHTFLVRSERFRLGLGLGLVSPEFSDIGFFSSLDLAFGDSVAVRAGWDIGWKDFSSGTNRSLLPSAGIAVSLPLGGKRAAADGSSPARIKTGASFSPLYGQVSAVSGALSLSWGSFVSITPVLPESGRVFYLSPNGDGIKESLEIPLRILNGQNAGAWEFRVDNVPGTALSSTRASAPEVASTTAPEAASSTAPEAASVSAPAAVSGTAPAVVSGTAVYSIGDSRSHPDSMQGMRIAGDTLAGVHAGVTIPASLVWDGRTRHLSDEPVGKAVPDGEYALSFRYRAIDGAWVRDHESFAIVIVDRKPPEIAFRMEGDGVFSPDGDNRKDTLILRLTGSKELLWRLSIRDGAGTVMTQKEWADAAPADFIWNGSDMRGVILPDGSYSANVEAWDRAGNSSSRRLDGIRIDTRSPKATLGISSLAISPNEDGVLDTLSIQPRLESLEGLSSFRLSILDESDFQLWTRDDMSLLASGKPFDFDGRTDKGDLLTDGRYRAVMRLEYGNGHGLDIPGPWFAVDTIAPEIRLSLVDAIPVFSPDNDGLKDFLKLAIAADGGSTWELSVLDAADKPVLTRNTAGMPPRGISWDGKDDAGRVFADGKYRFSLTLADEAGNSTNARSPVFYIDVSRPAGAITCDLSVFSPDGDGVLDTIAVIPRLETSVGLDSWSIQVKNAAGIVVRRIEGKSGEPVPDYFSVDGKDALSKKRWEDGRYRSEFAFSFLSGYAASAVSPWFVLDTIPPAATVEADRGTINPTSSGAGRLVRFSQKGTADDAWKAEIVGSDGHPVLVRDFGTKLPSVSEWDGADASGRLVPDGIYVYRLSGSDAAGHGFTSRALAIAVDTSRKTVSLTVDPAVFSPDNDGAGDTANFGITATGGVQSTSWLLEVTERPVGKRARIRGFSGKGGIPSVISWDGRVDTGKIAPDGFYSARMSVAYPNGDAIESNSVDFALDTNKPMVFVKAETASISPDGDGFKDEAGFTLIVDRKSGIASWAFSIVAADTTEKILFRRSGGDVPGRLVWDGRDETGSVVRGQVFGRLSVVYEKGDVVEASSKTIAVEEIAPKLEVVIMPDFFSPDGDGQKDMVTFLVSVDTPSRVASWRLEVLESYTGEGLPDSLAARERLFRVWNGNGAPPVSITWDGRNPGGEKVEAATDYPFRMQIRDFAGNAIAVNGIIAVDVLVVRDGPRIRISIPSIEFRASGADFIGLDPRVDAKNQRVLSRLALILQRFPDYRIRIEGHANNEAKIAGLAADKIEAEEKGEIMPLSLARAGFIRDLLVARGFDRRRFAVAGLGSSIPAVDPRDPATRWKNRRVEFILVREP